MRQVGEGEKCSCKNPTPGTEADDRERSYQMGALPKGARSECPASGTPGVYTKEMSL